MKICYLQIGEMTIYKIDRFQHTTLHQLSDVRNLTSKVMNCGLKKEITMSS